MWQGTVVNATESSSSCFDSLFSRVNSDFDEPHSRSNTIEPCDKNLSNFLNQMLNYCQTTNTR